MSEYRIRVTDSMGRPLPVTMYSINSGSEYTQILSAGPVDDGFILTDENIPEDGLTFSIESDGYYPFYTAAFYAVEDVAVNDIGLHKKPNYIAAVLVGAAILYLAQRYFKIGL